MPLNNNQILQARVVDGLPEVVRGRRRKRRAERVVAHLRQLGDALPRTNLIPALIARGVVHVVPVAGRTTLLDQRADV